MAYSEEVYPVYQAVKAPLDTLGSMTAKEKEQIPHGHFGERYNVLRSETIKLAPNVNAALWPSGIGFGSISGNKVCSAHFVELRAYLQTLLNLIPEEPFSYV